MKVVSLIASCLVALAVVGGCIGTASSCVTLGNDEPHSSEPALISPSGNDQPHSYEPILISPLRNDEPH